MFWLAQHFDHIYEETIVNIILYGARIGYYGPKQKIISTNLFSIIDNPDTLTINLEDKIAVDWLTEITNIEDHFICSYLGLVSKPNGKQYKIHHLSYPRGHLVNCNIPKNQGVLKYTIFDKIKQEFIQVGPSSIIIKYDLKYLF